MGNLSKLATVGLVLAVGHAEARLGGEIAVPANRSLADSPKKLSNVGSVLHGVDILRFDPSDPAGASLRQMIFRGQYLDKQETADGMWQVPDGTEMVNNFNCETQATAKSVTGETSYMQGVTNQFSFKAGGGVGPVKGTAENSNTFKTVSEGTNKNMQSFSFTEMICRLYKIQMQTNNLPPMTTAFVKAFNGIRGVSFDSEKVMTFIDDYGTHYTTTTSLGSKYVESFYSTREETSMLESSSTSVKVGAEVSAMGSSAGTSYLNEREKSAKDSFDKYSSSFQTRVLGANVPQGQTPQSLARSWIDETQKSNALMMISDFEFAGLDSLFAPGMLTYLNQGLKRENLKSMSSIELKSLQSAVSQAIINSCEARGLTCSGPTADILPPKAARVSPIPQDQLSVFGKSNGGSPFQLSGDVGKLFGKSGVQTADIYVSRVQVWTQKLEKEIITGLRVFYKNSQGIERPTPVAGLDTGTLCEIEISPIEKVGSIDIRSGSWIDHMEIRGQKGTSFGACGNKNGGGLSSIVFNEDDIFNGFFGRAGLRVDKLGVQKAKLVTYLT